MGARASEATAQLPEAWHKVLRRPGSPWPTDSRSGPGGTDRELLALLLASGSQRRQAVARTLRARRGTQHPVAASRGETSLPPLAKIESKIMKLI